MAAPGASDPELTSAVDRAIQQETRRYVKRLDALYTNPDQARAAFRAEVDQVGARAATRSLAQDPARFGQVRPGLSPVQVRALVSDCATSGSTAYELLKTRDNPLQLERVLEDRFHRGMRQCFQDGDQAYQRWSLMVQNASEGTAAERLLARPEAFGQLRPGIAPAHVEALVERARGAGLARGVAEQMEKSYTQTLAERIPALPRTKDELLHRTTGRLPASLEQKLEHFARDFRFKLARAYAVPGEAERRFHELVTREGSDGAARLVRRDPAVLGRLNAGPEAELIAQQAAVRGGRAYELNLIRTPVQAHEALERDQLRSSAYSVSNPREALGTIQEAVRVHVAERAAPEVGSPAAARAVAPATPAPAAPAPASPAPAADRSAVPAQDLPAPGAPAEAYVPGPVDSALESLAQAEQLAAQRDALYREIHAASGTLRSLEDAGKWAQLHSQQLDGALQQVYADPKAARQAFDELAATKGDDAALQALRQSPDSLGELRAETPDGVMGMLGKRSTEQAREHAAVAAQYGEAMLAAKNTLRDVEWNSAAGGVQKGAELVRRECTSVVARSAQELARVDTSLQRLGGTEGAQHNVFFALRDQGHAGPETAAPALDRAARANPALAGVAEQTKDKLTIPTNAAMLTYRVVKEAAKTVQGLAEGPSR